MNRRQGRRKRIWAAAVLLAVLVAAGGCVKREEPSPADAADAYLTAWQRQDYAAMYELLTPEAQAGMPGEQFVERYRNIYDGIEASGLTVEPIPQPAPDGEAVEAADAAEMPFDYRVKMDTVAGPIEFSHQGKLLKVADSEDGETKWLVAWEPSLIFPQMADGDKVRVETIAAERGEIVDRNGNGLAVNGTALQLGIVPGRLGEDAEEEKARLAEQLGIGADEIDRKLDAAWVKPELFVPIAYVDDGAVDEYADFPAVDFQRKQLRVYPYGEAAAHLTGYVGQVSAEDLERRRDEGYGAGDWIGKAGLEQIYEERLRGRNGAIVYVADADGNRKAVLAETQAVPGTTVQLTIDSAVQQAVYEEVKEDEASAAAIEPVAGDVLALVSSPAYDPNAFVRGLSQAQYEAWNSDPRTPFLNRFSKAYAPGSSFKVMTAAIGLDAGTLDPDKEERISGLRWTKDGTWGDYYVTRVHAVDAVDLRRALIHSDNIYFAQAALDVGTDAFAAGAARFGMGEPPPIPYPFAKSRIANDGIRNDIQLADSGYGQGEVLMTTLHVALVYSALVNDGHMIDPKLEIGESGASRFWKERAMKPETAGRLKDDLIRAVASPEGSGHGAYIAGASIAGKTGTAELKRSKDDRDGEENGWFVGFDADDPQLLLSVMIENVKGRGGSGYVAPKVKRIFQQTMK